jgi:hypothetical protein
MLRRAALVALAALAVAAAAGAAVRDFSVAPTGIADGQTVTGVVQLGAAIAGAPADHVEISVDGRLRWVVHDPYTVDWDTTVETNGVHVVELWAVAADGTVADARVSVDVENPFGVTLGGISQGQQVSGRVPLSVVASGVPPQWTDVLVDGQVRWTIEDPAQPVIWDTALETAGPHTVSFWSVAPNGIVATGSVQVVVASGQTATTQEVLQAALKLRAETWRMQRLMGVPRTTAKPIHGTRTELLAWRAKAAVVRTAFSHPPHFSQWLCIHSHEGSWTADTGNGYFGGLQMNMVFQEGYGPELLSVKGTADHWTPLEQMWVAERAYRSGRGFHPWPQTAHMCGYI